MGRWLDACILACMLWCLLSRKYEDTEWRWQSAGKNRLVMSYEAYDRNEACFLTIILLASADNVNVYTNAHVVDNSHASYVLFLPQLSNFYVLRSRDLPVLNAQTDKMDPSFSLYSRLQATHVSTDPWIQVGHSSVFSKTQYRVSMLCLFFPNGSSLVDTIDDRPETLR